MRRSPSIELRFSHVGDLGGYAEVSSTFETQVVFDVVGHALVERALDAPLRKDYDALENPQRWPELFDVSKWVLVNAFVA